MLQDGQQLLLNLLTIGYEGKTLEAFLNQLPQESVTPKGERKGRRYLLTKMPPNNPMIVNKTGQ